MQFKCNLVIVTIAISMVIYIGLSLATPSINISFAQSDNESAIINEDNITNATSSTYTDSDLGFSFNYPSSWTEDPDRVNAYNIAAFVSPDKTANVYIYLFPKEGDESLKDFGDKQIKNNEKFKVSEYYRNSTTKLADQPAVRASGTYFNTISAIEQSLGYQSSNTKTLQTFTSDDNNKGFIGIVLHADDKPSYDKFLPDVEQMIKSFKLISTGPIISEED